MKDEDLSKVLRVLNYAKEKADADGAKYFEPGYYSQLENAIEIIERKKVGLILKEDI